MVRLYLEIVHKCRVVDVQASFHVAGSLTEVTIDTQRRKHLAYLMADQGAIVNPESARNLPKQVKFVSKCDS